MARMAGLFLPTASIPLLRFAGEALTSGTQRPTIRRPDSILHVSATVAPSIRKIPRPSKWENAILSAGRRAQVLAKVLSWLLMFKPARRLGSIRWRMAGRRAHWNRSQGWFFLLGMRALPP